VKSVITKNAPFLLLIIAAIPVFYTLIYKVEQLAIQEKMKTNLENQLLHRITISENDVHWIREAKEIMVNGQMFDIRSSAFENGYYSFTGLFDNEETALVNQIEKTQQQNSSSNNKILLQLFQWLQSIYNHPQHTGHLAYACLSQENLFITPPLSEEHMGIIIPPPKAS
jgi:hypothetical protein